MSGAWLVCLGRSVRSGLGARGSGAWRRVAESLASVSRENVDGGSRGNLAGGYLIGQVANSLSQGKRPSGGSAGRLASLFSSLEPQLQPLYVPLPKVSHWVPLGKAIRTTLKQAATLLSMLSKMGKRELSNLLLWERKKILI